MSVSITRIIAFAVIGLAAVAAAGLWWRAPSGPAFEMASTPVRQSGQASIGGPFSLLDHTGKRVTQAMLAGHLTLIYFGYASCPDVCPMELQNIGAALDLIEKADPAGFADVQALFITIDPARDTVAALADYTSNFHPKLVSLTGSASEIATAARAYRIYFSKVEDKPGSQSYLMDHSNIIYLMGRKGEFLAHFSTGTGPEKMAAKLREFR